MRRLRPLGWLLGAAAATGAIALAAPRCARFLDQDSCLDGGGAWDHAHGRCVHDRQP